MYIKELALGAGCTSDLNTDRQIIIRNKNEIDIPIPFREVFVSFLEAFSKQLYTSDALFLLLNSMKRNLKDKGYNENDINDLIDKIKICMGTKRNKDIHNFMG